MKYTHVNRITIPFICSKERLVQKFLTVNSVMSTQVDKKKISHFCNKFSLFSHAISSLDDSLYIKHDDKHYILCFSNTPVYFRNNWKFTAIATCNTWFSHIRMHSKTVGFRNLYQWSLIRILKLNLATNHYCHITVLCLQHNRIKNYWRAKRENTIKSK